MINADETLASEEALKVIEGVEFHGKVNVVDEVLLANVRSAIRRPYPQIRPGQLHYDRAVIVGGGPSLESTKDELLDLLKEGAALVTVNGSYHWCLENNLIPKTQMVMDARPSNARFLKPYLPNCRYVLASQCAPETWDAVEGYQNVWMFHAVNESEGPFKELLDKHYLGNWYGVGGGITVVTRAISLLRATGCVRFDLFGVDCCFLDGKHHAYEQPENERDRAFTFKVSPVGHPELEQKFRCAPWHAKQFECFLQMIRVNGHHYQLNVHGNGLLASALAMSADLQIATEMGDTDGSTGV
jgi:hypothetical protein